MAALFPNPPIKTIPASPFVTNGTQVCGFYGTVFYNGARWGVGYTLDSPSTHNPPSAIKSTDGGTTWAQIDSAGTPLDLDTNAENLDSYFTDDGIIHVLASHNVGFHMAYAEFDMNAGTWGTAINSGTIVNRGGVCKMAQRLSGDMLVVYDDNTTLSYSLITGGIWGSKVHISTVVVDPSPGANYPVGILVDSSDVAHILYERFASGVSNELWHVSLDASNTPSTPVLVDTLSTSAQTPTSIGVGQIWSSKLLWAGNLDAADEVVLYEGTPLATPVFTRKLIASVGSQASNSVLFAHVLISAAGTPWIFWCNNPNADSDTIREIVYATYNGTTFSAPILAWDSIGNAAVGDPIFGAYTDGFSVSLVDDGSGPHVEMLADEFINADYRQSLVFFAEAVTPPPPNPSIICDSPPSGQVGSSYSHPFPASSGTPPYSFSKIAGTLPPGLSLNASTGVVSGIPTLAGLFSFTIQVMDSLGHTASVACSILIAAAPPPPPGLVITCGNPPSGIAGVPYSAMLLIDGGVQPYTVRVTVGFLPPDLIITDMGQIMGVPRIAGTYPFTVQVTDAVLTRAQVSCSITITFPISPPCSDHHDDVHPYTANDQGRPGCPNNPAPVA